MLPEDGIQCANGEGGHYWNHEHLTPPGEEGPGAWSWVTAGWQEGLNT